MAATGRRNERYASAAYLDRIGVEWGGERGGVNADCKCNVDGEGREGAGMIFDRQFHCVLCP